MNVAVKSGNVPLSSSDSSRGSCSPAASIMLTPVTKGEVAAVIRDLKAKNSRDVYGLTWWLLKQCFYII
ncbi:hypothetical protein J6590_089013 [Homalodisca vitripennis]|nr:hypothetical protein J6590_089013 [Homalodisca vitripennis]